MTPVPFHIVLIEDDPLQTRLVSEALGRVTNGSVEVRHAGRLDEASEVLRTGPVDAVLLDLGLPDSAGLPTLAEVRRLAPSAAIVVLTALDDRAVALEAIEAGAEDFIVKPHASNDLLWRSIEYAVRRHRSRRALEEHEGALRGRAARYTAVARLGERAIEAADLAVLLDEVVRTSAQTLGASLAGVFEFGGDGRTIRCRASAGFTCPRGAEEARGDARTPAGPFAEIAGPFAVEDVAADPRFADATLVKETGIRSLVAAPLHADLRPFGFVLVGSDRPRRFAPDDALFVQLVANVAAAAIGRRQVEESFQASEAGYRYILDSASEGIWAFDAHGRTTYVNRRAAQMLGYGVSEITGRPLAEFLFETDLHQLPGILGRADDQARQQIDFRLRCRDGAELWVLASTNPIFDQHGAFSGALGMFTDVTARRQAERALRQSEERYRRIVETANEGIWVFDAAGRTEYANPVMAELLGWPATELEGRSMIDFVFPDDRLEAERRLAMRRAGVREQAEIRLSHRSGREVWVLASASPILAAGGEVTGSLVMCVDVTARRQAEAERARLASAVEQAAEAVMRTRPDGRIFYVNPAFERITGYTAAEVLGQTPNILKGPRQDRAVYEELWRTIAAGEVWRGEISNKRKDGTTYTWEETITPVRGEAGDITEYIAICQDISDRRELEDRLRQSQKMEAIGRLAGGVAHDFNNLLTVITGYSERLLGQFDQADPRRKGADAIKRSADRAAALTHQLLAFSRRQILAPRVVDLNAIVGNMLRLLRRLIGEDIELRTVASPELWRVRTDPNQFEQVVMNLAVNSRDAMPGGGTLSIETANVSLDEAAARQHVGLKAGEYVCLTVADTGCGMTEDTLSHLFEPFFTTKEQGKGTGLGLSTIYGIVKQSGGYIAVESELNRGTTFKILLPRVVAEAEPEVRSEAAAGVTRGWETVLLVEDEEAVRQLLRDILRRFGYTVLTADSGPPAVQIAEQHEGPIHLLLTDVVMPQMSGWDVAERVSARRPGIKVIYMSGYIEHAAVEQRVIEAGTAFLGKPFSPDTLGRKVREVLDGR